MTAPRCPHCNATGLKYLAAQEVGLYTIVYCSQCGAIHGVVPQVQKRKVASQATSSPQTSSPPKKQQSPSAKVEPVKSTVAAPVAPKPAQAKLEDHNRPAFLQEIGYADLSKKVPYSPEKMASRMRAAGRGHSTQYMRIAVDEGPPVCLHCKIEMKGLIIPAGYPNKGAKVWVCPNYDNCKQWELAE
jgi:hypothetical protein